jgi:hypothetical protein
MFRLQVIRRLQQVSQQIVPALTAHMRTIALVSLATIAGVTLSLGVRTANVEASDGGGALSLPWASGASWLFNGPHTWGGDGLGAWSSLDLEGSDRGHDQVLSASSGTVHLDGKPASCGYVRVDQGNGWQTTYVHMTQALVTEGQVITRGYLLGLTDKNVSCFGSASADHVHFTIWFVPSGSIFCFGCRQYGVDWQGLHGGQGGWQEQIGNYIWTDGAQEYQGCATQVVTGVPTCWQNYLTQAIYNDGTVPGSAWRSPYPPSTVALGYYASTRVPGIQPIGAFPGRTDAYYLVANGLLGQLINTDGITWNSYAPIQSAGGDGLPILTTLPQPSTWSYPVGPGQGRLDVFGVGTDGNVWDLYYDSNAACPSGGWMGRNYGAPSLGTFAGALPRAFEWTGGCSNQAIVVYIRDAFNNLDSRTWSSSGGLSAWTQVVSGSFVASDAHPVGYAPNADLYWRGAVTSGQRYPLYHLPWGSSTPIEVPSQEWMQGDPYPVSSSPGRYDTFFRDVNANLVDVWNNTGSWGRNQLTNSTQASGYPLGDDPAPVLDIAGNGGCGCDLVFWQSGTNYLFNYHLDNNGILFRSPGGITNINTVGGMPGLATFQANQLTAIWPKSPANNSAYDYARYWNH